MIVRYLEIAQLIILAIGIIYNVVMIGGLRMRIENLQAIYNPHKAIRQTLNEVAARDIQTLKSVSFNHAINWILMMVILLLWMVKYFLYGN